MDASTPLESPWLTLKAAAGYVRRGPRFLAREIRAGRLRAARVGGRGEILTRREWLDVWVINQTTPIAMPVRRQRAS